MKSTWHECGRYRIIRGSLYYTQRYYISHDSRHVLIILVSSLMCPDVYYLLPLLWRAFRRAVRRYHRKYTNVGIPFLYPSCISIGRDLVVLTKRCDHKLSRWIVLQKRAGFWVLRTLVLVGEDSRTVEHDGVEIKGRGVVDGVFALGKLGPIEA